MQPSPPNSAGTGGQGRFLTGPTMGHVIAMTMTGAAGITFVFAVDAANLFWISQLGKPGLVAAIGYAFAVQFLSVSVAIGTMIATTALVSRQIGQGDAQGARDTATAALVISVGIMAVVAAALVMSRHQVLSLAGATGDTAALAARYLAVSLPSLPIMVAGMSASAALRAYGDGRRAMYVTLTSGSVSLLVDPALIVWLGLELDGAAAAVVISRLVLAGTALRYAIGTHDLLARPQAVALARNARPFAAIAVPAIATQIAAPFGNYLLTAVIAGFGDAAVAGWAVINRLTVLAFGGIFSLAGAIGGIFGQNYGAGLMDRVRTTYRDALIFVIGYTLVAWSALFALTDPIAAAFGLTAQARTVFGAFTTLGAGAFTLTGALFVSNAAFNTLGRPARATLMNWVKDGLLTWPAAVWMAGLWQASGVIYAQAATGAVAGIIAGAWGWFFVTRIGRTGPRRLDRALARGYRNPDLNRRR